MFITNAATMLQNIGLTIPELMRLATAIMYVLGMYIVVNSIAGMKNAPAIHSAGQGQTSMWAHIKHLFVGVALIYFPSTVHVGTATLFGESSPYGYVTNSISPYQGVLNAALQVCLLVGVIAVGKGIYELGFGNGHNSQEKGHTGSFAKGIAHIFGGVCLINLQMVITVIFNTLGISN